MVKEGKGGAVEMGGGGTLNINGCAKLDAFGNIVSAGASCGSGGGSAANLLAGTRIVLTSAGANTTVSVDTAIVPSFLSLQVILAYRSIPAQTCTELPMPVARAAEDHPVPPSW